jgi:hypothetical protein
MPQSLFDPSNAGELKRYEQITCDLYGLTGSKLEVGRCKDIGYTRFVATGSAAWAPTSLMGPICKEQCGCIYPDCKDVPDDPANGKFCSLCGPKFNADILIDEYTK